METTTMEENLDEVLRFSQQEVEASIVTGAAPVCDECAPAMKDRARCLTGFAGIGRLSIGKAVELLSAYNQAICNHLGAAAIAEEIPELEFASV
jgi:hypothetical protein